MNKDITGQTLFLDCFSGIAGDMFAAALLDLGAGSLDRLRRELAKLDLEGWSVSLESVKASGIAASRLIVNLQKEEEEPRSLAAIEELLAESRLEEAVRSHCLAIFSRVARAEAQAHGETLDTVHFHELGMVDSIIDIVSTCILIEQLSPREIIASPLALGAGIVDTRHGSMPVPAPATAILLKGVPVFQGKGQGELTTPTGAALVSYFAGSFGPMPSMKISSIGYGAGSDERWGGEAQGRSLLRLIMGERTDTAADELVERQVLLETNIDDSSPEQLAFLAERLLEAGAADAWLTPVIMKKGRSGVLLSVLCSPGQEGKHLDLIFAQSSTFGVRERALERHCLLRREETVETRFGAVRVKIGSWRGRVVTVSPEYEDCRRVSLEKGAPIAVVYDAARQAAAKLEHEPGGPER